MDLNDDRYSHFTPFPASYRAITNPGTLRRVSVVKVSRTSRSVLICVPFQSLEPISFDDFSLNAEWLVSAWRPLFRPTKPEVRSHQKIKRGENDVKVSPDSLMAKTLIYYLRLFAIIPSSPVSSGVPSLE